MKPLFPGILAGLACVLPAAAASPQAYVNARFGFSVNVPKTLSAAKTESDNGDGAAFHSKDGAAELRVWGSNILDGSFADAVKAERASEKDGGWSITLTGGDGKRFAVYSGTKADRIVYARVIPACAGTATVNYRLEYPLARKVDFDPAIRELNASLKAAKGACN